MLAPAGTLFVWTFLDALRSGKPTAVGAATAIVVGLVAVTPAAGFVSPLSALLIGALAAVPCHFAIQYRSRTALDDSLDVLAAHGIGGITGALLTGVLAERAWGGVDGLVGGNPKQVALQAMGVVVAALYSIVATFTILKLVSLALPLRSRASDEAVGLDVALHGEEAYARGEGAVLVRQTAAAPAVVPAALNTAVAGGD
jgi:Amt family ammonium transporter